MATSARPLSLCVLLGLLGAGAAAAERTATDLVPADAWLAIAYDGAHPGLRDTTFAQFFREPEVQDALKQWQPLLDKVFEQPNRETGMDLLPLFRSVSGCEAAVAITGLGEGKGEPAVLLVGNVGAAGAPARQEVEKLVAAVKAKLGAQAVKPLDLGGQARAETIGNAHTAFDGPFFLIANDLGVLRRALDPATPKLAQPQGAERAVLRLRYDHPAMLKAFGERIPPDARRVMDALGLGGLGGVELALAPRGKRLVASLTIEMPDATKRLGPLKGLADATPYDPELLKMVPKNATLFWLGGIDFAWLWDEVWATVGRVDPKAAEAGRAELAKLEEKAGVKVREGLLAPLGRGTLLVGAGEGIWHNYSVLIQRARDPEALDKGIALLVNRLDLVLMGIPDVGAVRLDLKTFQYRGHTCRYLWMMGKPALALPGWSPAYTRVGDLFIFALNPLQLKGYLDFLADKGPTVLENEEFRSLQAVVPKGATSISYGAYPDVIVAFYNTLAPIACLLQGVPDLAPKVDVANMPSSRLLARYARGSIAYTLFADGRFKAETQGDGVEFLGPNTMPIAVGAIVAGMTLPALARARTEARRIQDRNNLNMLAKGIATWLNEFGDDRFYPPSIADLFDKKIIPDPGVFVSPLDPDPPKLPNGLRCSYVSCFDQYPTRQFLDDFPPNIIMAWNRKAFVEGLRNVLFFDWHQEWVEEDRFQALLKELDENVKRLTKERQPGEKGIPKRAPAKGQF